MDWNIGERAKELDDKSISERMKVEKRSLKKIIVAIGIYFLCISIFILLL